MLSDKVYDVLKFIALVVIPAVATLYASLGALWGLPYINEIVGTITALDTFLGAILQISTAKYNEANNG